MQMALRIEIDREECVGSGRCCAMSPRVFQLDKLELAIVVDPCADSDESILRAARECPTQAITVFRDGEKIV